MELGEKEKARNMAMDIAKEFNSMVGYHLEKERLDNEFRKYSSGLQYLEVVMDQYGFQAEKDSIANMIIGHGLRTPDRRNF